MMQRLLIRPLALLSLMLGGVLLWLGSSLPSDADDSVPHVARLSVAGAIGPATTDYLARSMAEATDSGARAIVIEMDTPGGLDAATRDIIKHILASPVPVVTYVHPAGSRAASAGTYILYASHVAAMTPSTTLGAATPVQMGGPAMPGGDDEAEERRERAEQRSEDADNGESDRESAPQPGSAMERKVINDAVAFIRGLAERHGRNADWAERAVREAVSLTASEALEQNVVDVVARNMDDLLEQLDGRTVIMDEGERVLEVADLPVRDYAPDWRTELLSIITNPQVASILFLIGIYGLILEGYNPGTMIPGVVGVISLLLALYALQVLPVNYAGVALIVVGALMILGEAFMPSFGILGIGGVIAVVIGSIILVDTDIPGMEVSYELIGAIAATGVLMVLGILWVVGSSVRRPRVASNKAMIGRHSRVRYAGQVIKRGDESLPNGVRVMLDGELWNAWADEPLSEGQNVIVVDQHGLVLKVQAADTSAA
ncbi:NfeD family protein [Marinimicrobium alkaliphilum]|uniref:NfeD family protein n=1 Tax=Marinimicrobium alkaliphilum TaxID=2202654 RepID=UPI001E5D9FBA|nr:nodulation protein NfeD [Marinimicrobium alkaliphilum]